MCAGAVSIGSTVPTSDAAGGPGGPVGPASVNCSEHASIKDVHVYICTSHMHGHATCLAHTYLCMWCMDVHIYFTWQVRSVTLTRAEMCVAGPGFHGVAFTRTAPILLYGHISDPSLGPPPTLLTALAPHTPLLPLTVNYKYIISRCLLRGVAAAAVGSYLDSAWESIV